MNTPPPGVIWTPTRATDVRLPDLRVMHGGPVAMYLPEHAHPETQVEVHFRRPRGCTMAEVRPAETLLIAPTRPHIGKWEEGSEVIVLLVSPDLLARTADELLTSDRFEIVSGRLARSPWLQRLGAEIRNELRAPYGASRFYLESLGHVAAGHLLRHHAERAPWRETQASVPLRPADLRKADAFIDEHLQSGFSVGALASELGLGPSRLHRRFKAATGLTPHQYVLRRRIARARQLLANRRMDLSEIAWRLGFANQSHFTAVFRRAMGMTPGGYRRDHFCRRPSSQG